VSEDTEKDVVKHRCPHMPTRAYYLCWRETFFHILPHGGLGIESLGFTEMKKSVWLIGSKSELDAIVN